LQLGLHEINDAAEVIYNLVSDDANIILGSVIDESLGDEIMVTVIATGFEQAERADYGMPRGYMGTYAAPLQAPYTSRLAASSPAVNAPYQPEHGAVVKPAVRQQGQEGLAGLDARDLDTPTFMRKKKEDQEDTR